MKKLKIFKKKKKTKEKLKKHSKDIIKKSIN